MAEDTGSSQETKDQLDLPVSSRKNARKKIRPTYSCLSCHKRKVKCDRVKPCGACCLRGTPSECEYGNSKQDRSYIEQAAVIENLLQSHETLQQQLDYACRQLDLFRSIKREDRASSPLPPGAVTLPDAAAARGDDGKAPDDAEARAEPSAPQRIVASRVLSNKRGQPPQALHREKTKLSDPTLARALIEMFIERLIGEFSPTAPFNFGGTLRLRQAAEMRVFSPMLCNAFEAASLTFTGNRQQNRSIEMAGHARYIRVLGQLQNAVYNPLRSQYTDVLTVVLLSTIIEAFKQSSKDSIFKHQLGGLHLLRSRTPYRHRYGLERSLFVDLRLYWVTAALAQRQPTFLASREWLTVPWLGDNPPKDVLHRLLDVAVDIPAYLSQVDTFSFMLQTISTSSSELIGLQSTIWEEATELDTRLQLWESMCVKTYPGGEPCEELDPVPIDGFPVFQCRNPTSLETLSPRDLIYPDLLLATSMCFYWAMRLMISSTDGGLVSVLTMQDRYESACNICRSMRYYVHNIPGLLVSRMIFVLRTAYDSFADGTVERQFVRDLFLYIGKKFEFPVFSNKCNVDS